MTSMRTVSDVCGRVNQNPALATIRTGPCPRVNGHDGFCIFPVRVVLTRNPHSDERRMKRGATLLGISLEEYRAHVENGEKWCGRDHRWEPLSAFGPHPSRPSGLANECIESNRAAAREASRRNYAARKRAAAQAIVKDVAS